MPCGMRTGAGIWHAAQHDAGTATEETCTQYNILKVARTLFQWTGSSRFSDFYETAILNGIIGAPAAPGVTCLLDHVSRSCVCPAVLPLLLAGACI